MKKILISLIALFCFIPMLVSAKDDLVKVYVFEAGGCPFCDKQIEYLKGLDSYNKKFEIVKKELYIDHIEWKQGNAYDLGVTVSDAFNKAGFVDASYQGTPFVVISDIYATTGYSVDLEKYINQAYEEGDKDAVACLESGKSGSECITSSGSEVKAPTTTGTKTTNSYVVLAWTTVLCSITMIVVYLVKSTLDTKKLINALKK